jgi:lysophospholipase L1-like esterase
VQAANLGRAGLTTTGLVEQLGGRSTREALSGAATVVVTIGANDLVPLIERRAASGCDASCSQPAVDQMGEGLARALARVRVEDPALRQLLVTTYWNVFEDGDVADALRGPGFADWSDGVTKAANAAICRDAVAASATCVDLYTPFVGSDGQRNPTSLLADDGDHPNAAGHAVIAAALLEATP